MPAQTATDQRGFRRILVRNIALPLIVGVVTVGVFVALILYLLSALNWVDHSEQVIGDANELQKLAVDQETGVRGFLITGNQSFLVPYEIAKPKFDAQILELTKLVEDNPQQIERLHRIEALQAKWSSVATDFIDLRRKNLPYQDAVNSGTGKIELDEIRREFAAFLEVEQALRFNRVNAARDITTFTVIGFLSISLALSVLLAYFGRRDLTALSVTFGSALAKHEDHAAHLQRQAWLRTGQMQLTETAVGQHGLPALSAALLDFLAKYVSATVGAIYVRGDDAVLRRIAAFGLARDQSSAEQAFEPGETLVGQALRSRRPIHIKDPSGTYLNVSSGLGRGKPVSVAVVPTINDGIVNGVVELAFMRDADARDIEFLELVADNVGAFIDAALYRQRLQQALEETQQLNEELQVQQEELRVANEELEQQSQVLEESQAGLEAQRAELEQTNQQLSTQAAVLDQKNDALTAAHLELETRADELARASRYKSEFLANMSHELRTPLNSSLILARLLAENPHGNLTDEQVKFAQTIHSAGNDLLNLINDILDISKVEAGKLEVQAEDLSLARLAESLSQMFEPSALQKGLALSVELDADAPSSIFTDRQRAEQIIKNLLSNAIKFTDSGFVKLTVRRGAGDSVLFAVADSGIGVAPEHQRSIFEAFRQGDGTTSRRYGGTGLGLSISRELAGLLGGSIDVMSEPGKGSVFTLALPLRWTHAGEQSLPPVTVGQPANVPGGAVSGSVTVTAPTGASSAGIATSAAHGASAGSMASVAQVGASNEPGRLSQYADDLPIGEPAFEDDRNDVSASLRTVLVVEDDVDFARILFDLAHEMQFRCLVAHTAADGYRLAMKHRPDAILLDIYLPDRSGLTVLEELKDTPQTRHIPVHVVSAVERSNAALQLGAIGHAPKPTTREQLRDIFLKLEERFTRKVKRVLLVEDDARQRESVVKLIGDDDIEITAVETGEEALDLIGKTLFDCMIVDLKLPDMQGGELLQRLSEQGLYAFPPVIIYTGRSLTRDEEAKLMKYSRSIIIKDARSPERLLDEVTLFLHKVESELSQDRQVMLRAVRSRDRVFEGRRVLLVDDDIRNVFALSSALEQKGAIVEVGRNGFEAIEKLDRTPEIDLVLMDVMMPGLDGLEATRRIRADARFAKLPIIAITAKAMKDDQEQCLKAGASDYLAKPVNLDRLFSLLRVWMPALGRS
ncbi:histidine kinase [Pararobbsia alpina]|uniref:response regulator n=1 Tax=Pararobbsia alpina TaxID=621374 RepID=UPI0039A49CB8